MDGALSRPGRQAARDHGAGAALTAARTWIGLFRGINVGGHNKVPMRDLAELLGALGCRDVRTYIQSGNVVLRAGGARTALAARIGAAMAERFGFRPGLVLLPASELARAVAANPFRAAVARPQSLHLWFLERRPPAPRVRALDAQLSRGERCALRGRVLYLHAPLGIGKSRFAARAEGVLGVAATARNWRTVTELLALARGPR